MTKNELAKNVNTEIKNIGRTITSDYLLELKEGDIITTEKAESWTDGGNFTPEWDKEYTYVFFCKNACPVHAVDYENEEELAVLSAEDCYNEKEVLVPTGTRFKVVFAGTEGDHEEMGYITVEVEYIGDFEESDYK